MNPISNLFSPACYKFLLRNTFHESKYEDKGVFILDLLTGNTVIVKIIICPPMYFEQLKMKTAGECYKLSS